MSGQITRHKWDKLQERMKRCGLHEKDLAEQFVRSAGHGGQNVNKVATCVVLRHVPTGRQVKCQAGRSQAINRYQARLTLTERTEREQRTRRQAAMTAAAKERSRKRRRSKAGQEQVLERKREHSRKKRTGGRSGLTE